VGGEKGFGLGFVSGERRLEGEPCEVHGGDAITEGESRAGPAPTGRNRLTLDTLYFYR
jgi:hypothetical protein